jgi:hypothetical protein
MKKLLTMFLVLGIASAASATTVNLTLSSDDVYTDVTPGTIITVKFSIDQNIKSIANTGSSPGIDFTVSGATNTFAVGSWTDATVVGTTPGTLSSGDIVGAYYTTLNLKNAHTVLYTASLTINENGSVGMSDLDNDEFVDPSQDFPPIFYTIGTVTGFNVTVPEPMTIALLGLGGLFLRRRR